MNNNMRNQPLPTIQKLIKERYIDAKSVFWAGSVAVDQATIASDLDLIIIFEQASHAYREDFISYREDSISYREDFISYREAFIYDGWPIDAFVHDINTLQTHYKLEASDGKPALINMILQGREILLQNSISNLAKSIAEKALVGGPDKWTQAQIDKERFLITDILDDIEFPKDKEEQIISVVHLFEPLLQFYFRAQKKWAASGKSLIRLLKVHNPELAKEWVQAFEELVKTGDSKPIKTIVIKILEPYGGCLWDGFRYDASKESRVTELQDDQIFIESKLIEALEKVLLDPYVRQSAEQLNKLIADDFLEFGSSGNVYNKQDCIKPDDIPRKFLVSDFKVKELSKDVMLATYKTTEHDITSLRSSIWKRYHDEWQMIFHQGTNMRTK